VFASVDMVDDVAIKQLPGAVQSELPARGLASDSGPQDSASSAVAVDASVNNDHGTMVASVEGMIVSCVSDVLSAVKSFSAVDGQIMNNNGE
jgi:hypothetical protein